MLASEAVWRRLALEVDTVFFVPGGGSMFLLDALGRSGLTHVSAIHEQGAGYMAVGYAQATGGLGVCLTSAGVSAVNALSACLAAWTDSVPVLFISGQSRSATLVGDSGMRVSGLQEAPIVSMAAPITKVAYEIRSGVEALFALEGAIHLCLHGRRGPAWLSFPQDFQAQDVGEPPNG
jgi:acetolactate synthase-1/2/3 large subunit